MPCTDCDDLNCFKAGALGSTERSLWRVQHLSWGCSTFPGLLMLFILVNFNISSPHCRGFTNHQTYATMLPGVKIIHCWGLNRCLPKSSILHRKQVFRRQAKQLGFHSISIEIVLLFVNDWINQNFSGVFSAFSSIYSICYGKAPASWEITHFIVKKYSLQI